LLASFEASGIALIERRYSPAEHPYIRGNPDEGLWFLLEGTLEVYKIYGAFRKATVRLLDGSGLFGEPSLRSTGRHRDSSEALSACRVAKVPKGTLLRHLSQDSSCAPALLQAFAECADECEAAMERLHNRRVDSRLARLLLELAERFGEEGGRGTGVRIRLSHHDLSCMVACTREAVSKSMREFKEAGLIETPRPCRVVVVDEAHLSAVAMERTMTTSYGPTGSSLKFSGRRTLASL
jgi:CRP-like cAMP-binding protein